MKCKSFEHTDCRRCEQATVHKLIRGVTTAVAEIGVYECTKCGTFKTIHHGKDTRGDEKAGE